MVNESLWTHSPTAGPLLPPRLEVIPHGDVILIQPLSCRLSGIAAAQEEFAALLAWMPDLQADIVHWQGDTTGVFIELNLAATWGSQRIEWPCVDRPRLRDGKAIERVAYFAPLPSLLELPRHRSAWWSWWSSGSARPWHHGQPPITVPLHRSTQ
ncbi:nuclear transport factor 2 family protein [Rhodococcus qingshengii]|uniref:nuclear transport factor 2 family protein n=1 Tax=Rhodococcus qingshengii TaxID=334542 RepID=UPI0036D9D944